MSEKMIRDQIATNILAKTIMQEIGSDTYQELKTTLEKKYKIRGIQVTLGKGMS